MSGETDLEKALAFDPDDTEFVQHDRTLVKYQSDHNAVYGYFPGLIDEKYNVAIFTYNEKGNSCDVNGVNQFLADCAGLSSADIIIAGIQEGDPGLAFIKGIRDYKGAGRRTADFPEGVFTHSAGIKVGELAWAMTEEPDKMEWDDNAVLLGGGGERVRQAVYKSFGKECRGKGSLLCLVNGIYVIIPEKSRLGANPGNNVPLNIQTGVKPVMPGYSKHMAWACIDTGRSQTVFFSCHLEYSGDVKHVGTGYKFGARANQLDGYLEELTAKFPGAGAYISLGDTNMRTLYAKIINTNWDVYMIDQMMFYLLQVRPDDLEFYRRMMLDVQNDNNLGLLEHYYPTKLYNQTGIDLFLARVAMIDGINKETITRISRLNRENYQDKTLDYRINSIINAMVGTSPLNSKMKAMWQYATKDGIAEDPYAGYCLNPEFNINGTGIKYRAYDFTYKPIARATEDISELQEIYSYGPTAIFTLDLDAREGGRVFDAGKRVKSGGLLGPSHTDRILMFVPVRNNKIRFINLA